MSPNPEWKYVKLINSSTSFVSNRKLLSHDVIFYLLKALENADSDLSAVIENDLVLLGKKSISPLIQALDYPDEKVKGHVAMSLIRIGSDSLEPLLKAYGDKPELAWMVDFIVSEIQGKQEDTSDEEYINSIAS